MERFFGGQPWMVVLRLVVISVIVGVVMSALGITLNNAYYKLQLLFRRIYDLGFGTFDWLFGYFIIGAIFVIPIWLLSRVFGIAKGNKPTDRT